MNTAALLLAALLALPAAAGELSMEEQRRRYLATVPEWGEPARALEQYKKEVSAARGYRPGSAGSLTDVERRNLRITREHRLQDLAKIGPSCSWGRDYRARYPKHYPGKPWSKYNRIGHAPRRPYFLTPPGAAWATPKTPP